jgi:hypothetical protein
MAAMTDTPTRAPAASGTSTPAPTAAARPSRTAELRDISNWADWAALVGLVVLVAVFQSLNSPRPRSRTSPHMPSDLLTLDFPGPWGARSRAVE